MKNVQTILLILVVGTGCSTHLVPALNPEDTFPITEFTTLPATVINAQSAAEDIEIGSSGKGMGQIPRTVYGNLQEWTETACDILTEELKTRSVPAAGKAPKVMRLSVTDVAVLPVTFLGGNTIKVNLTVETGEGTSRDFEVEHTHASRRDVRQNAGAALMKAIATLLNDDAIRSYLQN